MGIAREFNERLEKGEIGPSVGRRVVWWVKRLWGEKVGREEQEIRWKMGKRKRASLAWALNDVIGRRFWIAGVYKVTSSSSQPPHQTNTHAHR